MIMLFLSGAFVLLVGAITGAMLALVTMKMISDTDMSLMDDSGWEEWPQEEEL